MHERKHMVFGFLKLGYFINYKSLGFSSCIFHSYAFMAGQNLIVIDYHAFIIHSSANEHLS